MNTLAMRFRMQKLGVPKNACWAFFCSYVAIGFSGTYYRTGDLLLAFLGGIAGGTVFILIDEYWFGGS